MRVIFKLIDQIYPTKQKKNFNLLNNIIIPQKINKKKTKKEITFFIIKEKKFSLFKVFKIIFLLIKDNRFKKNFLIFFNFKNEIIAHDLIPDLPSYKSNSSFFNLLFWIKKSLLIFFKSKFVNCIVLKLR